MVMLAEAAAVLSQNYMAKMKKRERKKRKKYPSDTLEDRIVLRLVMGWTTGIYHYKESLYPGFYRYISHLQQCPIEL